MYDALLGAPGCKDYSREEDCGNLSDHAVRVHFRRGDVGRVRISGAAVADNRGKHCDVLLFGGYPCFEDSLQFYSSGATTRLSGMIRMKLPAQTM